MQKKLSIFSYRTNDTSVTFQNHVNWLFLPYYLQPKTLKNKVIRQRMHITAARKITAVLYQFF